MLVLHNSQKLQILYKSLEKSIPESIKVYGAIFNIKDKNPFNMEVLVDAWPDYQIVITRPQKQEMKDDQDHYTNTYHIFTKAPDKLEEVLSYSNVISWEQTLQIQGCQEGLDEAIRKVATSKSVQVDYMKTILFIPELPKKHKTSSNDKMELFEVDDDNKEGNFSNMFLDASHAGLVNEHWAFGKNERSLKYIERCLQDFLGFGVLGPERQLVSWIVMEQSCELRMGYTVPKYRHQGNMLQIGYHLEKYLSQKEIPFYFHVADNNEKSLQALNNLGFKICPCGWHQWKCTPKKYC
ncbi:GLYATL2 isoform 2 [Pan troglodytes]|uniref:Glycine N-acyltransferase-like protein n=4 Tax=Pan TaxID=9596 RepID=A0A6D2XT32_PANTR|nr:glycine N-acyltransferase-like protein 2 [Pan troglodytes]XP_054950339.1 glycine N-acyltransferase-like protein 2 isoform X1 [Pan paniscus]PNI44979.1 GLYATL2 isoform 1 [Pan troglodytes]PNI44980.1 GLYATL2 isoform 2 [Pan troglodytes]